MLLGAIRLALADRQAFRHQQWLAAQPLAGHGGLQALVGDALMGSVHVDQHQAGGVLGQDVDALELGQGIAQRRNVPAGLRQRHCLGTRQRGEVVAVGALELGGRCRLRGARDIAAGARRPPGRRVGGTLQHTGGQAHLRLRAELAGLQPGGSNHRRDGGRRGQLILRAHLAQGTVQGAVEEVVNRAAVAKAHLVLGRVHVDIDRRRIELQEQHEGRMPAVIEHVAIGLAHRMGDQLVAHHAAVDIEVLQVRLAA